MTKKITQSTTSHNTNLETIIHDLSGPLTALTMTLPELTKALDNDPKTRISTKMYVELCNAATLELHKRLEKLRTFTTH